MRKTTRLKLWEIEDRGNYADVRASESRKVREDNAYDKTQIDNGVAQNGYIGTSWSNVRFAGHAYNKLKTLGTEDTVTNLEFSIDKEPYYGDTSAELNFAISSLERANIINEGAIKKLDKQYGKVFPKVPRITIWDFDTLAEAEEKNNANNQYAQNIDKAPQVEVAVQKPVQPIAQPVQPATYQQVPVQPTTTYQQPVAQASVANAADECPF